MTKIPLSGSYVENINEIPKVKSSNIIISRWVLKIKSASLRLYRSTYCANNCIEESRVHLSNKQLQHHIMNRNDFQSQ